MSGASRSSLLPIQALQRRDSLQSRVRPESETLEWKGGAILPRHNSDQFTRQGPKWERLPGWLTTQLTLPSERWTDSSTSPPSVLPLQQGCH